MTAAGIGGFGGVGGFGGLKPALVYRNFRIIATNRPAATRARPRQTTVARLRERQGNPSAQPDSCQLYMAAAAATRFEPLIRDFHQRLLYSGLTKTGTGCPAPAQRERFPKVMKHRANRFRTI
ncbi:hypothetical protein EEH04_12215, partial [Neisseria gonorrhoeae]